MIYTYAELENKLGGYHKVKLAIKNGDYFKISHGKYSDKSPYLSEIENIFAQYPNSILALQSAFSFYDLSDFVPDKYVVATANVNIRVGNDKSYKKIGLLMKGKKLLYVAETENGWYAVKNGDQVSWVSAEFAKVE